jgi:hypothetical protein
LAHGNRQISLDLNGAEVDAFRFNALIQKGTPDALAEAVSIHATGLLSDWDECWLTEAREEYLADFVEAVKALARTAEQNGDLELAASYLKRYVDALPEMDSAWARLIDAYVRSGNDTLARQTCERYHAYLKQRSADEGREILPSRLVLAACPPASDAQEPAPAAHDVDDPASEPAGDVSEMASGAVPLDSPFYLARPIDAEAIAAVRRQDSFVLIKGARQTGKSSLLARIAHDARDRGAKLICTDWQKIPIASVESTRSFLLDLAETFVEHLDLDMDPHTFFPPERAATRCFEKLLRRGVFPAVAGPIVWLVDEADRLFDCRYRDDVFAMLRSWHNERAIDHSSGWKRLTVVLAYATEAYLFISNMDQSPFNVGLQLETEDFTPDQVAEMNRRYGGPLRTEAEIRQFTALVGGHPYLVRMCLQRIATGRDSAAGMLNGLETGAQALRAHLDRIRICLQRDPELAAAARAFFVEGKPPAFDHFIRLRAAGLICGAYPACARPRCRLYELYLKQALCDP